MLDSFFIITSKGEIIIERHFKRRIPRSVAEKFYDVARKDQKKDLKPVLQQPGYFVTHIIRNDVYFVAVNRKEMDPLIVTNFLDRLVEIFKTYLHKIDERSLKNGFVTIYQLLDEIVDNGFALTTELTLLNDLVKPHQKLMKKLSLHKGGSGQSSVPWRKRGIKYSANEIFFDVEESMNCLVNTNGSPSICEINGVVRANCFLSEMPDIILTFNNTSLFRHILFHPCVRYVEFQENQCLSFVPPDGEFVLARYKVPNIANLPLYCRAQVNFFESGASVSIVVGPRQKEGVLGEFRVEFPCPTPLNGLKNLNCTYGQLHYLHKEKKFRWTLGRMLPNAKTQNCTGKISWASTEKVQSPAAVSVTFKLDKVALSGLKVDRVDVYKVKYKPFKGVKYFTKAGMYEVRTV